MDFSLSSRDGGARAVALVLAEGGIDPGGAEL
jgi:hypothetical protein